MRRTADAHSTMAEHIEVLTSVGEVEVVSLPGASTWVHTSKIRPAYPCVVVDGEPMRSNLQGGHHQSRVR